MAATGDPVIVVEDLVAGYGGHTVLDGVSFEVRRGEIFVILGGSGCGKSTLLRNLVGLMQPDSGRIRIGGRDFTVMSEAERIEVRKKIGMCFQGAALFNSMTLADNVALPLREHTKLSGTTIDIMTRLKLDLVGLGGYEDYLPSELSGGMRKRAGLARAMAMDPEFIFYDEPSAGLDPVVAAGIDMLIRKMQSTFNLTSVVVTHELASVRFIADRVCMIRDGRIIGIGTLDELETSGNPFVQQFFHREPDKEEHRDAGYIRALTENG